MTEEVDSLNELVTRIQNQRLKIITIDGLYGVGKTTLAHDLSRALSERLEHNSISVISLDLFLRSELTLFRYKIGTLRNILKEILKITNYRIVIIEGVLVREVMDRLRRATNNRVSDREFYYIYYKMKSINGYFDSFYDAGSLEELTIGSIPPSMTKKQLFHYHQKFNPCEKANFIYIRTVEE